MPVFVLLLALAVILVLLAVGRRRSGGASRPGSRRRSGGASESAPLLSVCPACGSSLEKGQRVHGVAWPGREERMMYIYGCPYCFRRTAPGSAGPSSPRQASGPPDGRPGGSPTLLQRTCPVCRSPLRDADFLLGRMWEEGRIRVHVVGCSRCRKV